MNLLAISKRQTVAYILEEYLLPWKTKPAWKGVLVKAIWNGVILAESDKTLTVEGNHYFPVDAVKKQYLVPSDTQSICPRKGMAYYHTVVVKGDANRDAAWHYPQPKEGAREIKNHIAFWKGVEIIP